MFQQADLTETLQGIPWFVELKPEQINRLATIAWLKQLQPGEELFVEGGKQDYIFILLEGEINLELFVPLCGQKQIYVAEPLDIIGWDPLTPVIRQRFGTAAASKPCLLIALAAHELLNLCEEDHDLGVVIYRRIANVVASRMLNVRLTLSDTIVHLSEAI